MIQKHRIRLNSTESVNSVNKDNKVVVELKQTTKPYFFTSSIREQIDQYEVFQRERDNCTKYRLITTIKPYCTNILFNPVTEIIKNEGSSNVIVVTDTTDNNETLSVKKDEELSKALGKQTELTRSYMVKNTEYSSENIGYEYHPGYDIFNNHLLRSNSFKIVNNNRGANRDVFNTIEDFAREYDGSVITFRKRKIKSEDDTFTVEGEKPMHLYQHEDILSITDAVNQRLIDENGWVGFVNRSVINAKDKTANKWHELDFNRVVNNKENCDFIDMYPDRTLYSFNPKYNSHKHKPEYNWKTYLTYPYENFYDHELIKDGTCNAVLVQEATYTTGTSGQDVILFKTYIKHNLRGGSVINLYYRKKKFNDNGNNETTQENDKYNVIENVIISDVGDLDKNHDDFYFYTTDTRVITELEENLFGKNELTKGKIDVTFRYKNVVNGYESEYYVRIFRKLPNLLKSQKITEEDTLNKKNLDEYIEKCDTHFDNETYKLGFSNTIYNDNNTQITFTDSIEIDKLLDNRGMPLSEIYLTIVKNNKGNHIWYKEGQDSINKNHNEIEYSHCFSDVLQGFELFCDDVDSINERDNVLNSHPQLSNIRLMHTGSITNDTINYTSEDRNNFGWGNLGGVIETREVVSIDNDKFIGDIVEYNPTVCVESVLSEGQFRFNTYLRDNPDSEKYVYTMDDIKTDDYDSDAFEIETRQSLSDEDLFHPEGYYYKAHYQIPLREWGELQQSSHFDIKVKSATKINIGNKLCTIIRTTLPHRLDISDTLLICCDEEDKIMKMTPAYIFDELTFAIGDYTEYNAEKKGYDVVISSEDICDILNNKFETITFKLRRYNSGIPYYASKIPNKNKYLWRTLNGVGNKYNISLKEYPFANSCFYINQDINFYLKRQDPFGKLGMYYNEDGTIVPDDIFGNILTPSEYEYKEENEVTC